MARAKVETFVSLLNVNRAEVDFFKRFTLQLTGTQLDTLLAEMENGVEIPENIPKAASIVGKNVNQHNNEIWALNRDLFVDSSGHVVDPIENGMCWIGHLVQDAGNSAGVAREERSLEVNLPLTTRHFDLACHLLRGDLLDATSRCDTLADTLDGVLREAQISAEVVRDHLEQTVENSNFLSTFFTASMSLIIAHYDKVGMICN